MTVVNVRPDGDAGVLDEDGRPDAPPATPGARPWRIELASEGEIVCWPAGEERVRSSDPEACWRLQREVVHAMARVVDELPIGTRISTVRRAGSGEVRGFALRGGEPQSLGPLVEQIDQ